MGKGRGNIAQVLKESELIEPRRNRICLFEDDDLNWYFDESELMDIQRMWEQEIHVNYMAHFLNRNDVDEVVLAVMHLSREGKLPKRYYGLFKGIQGPYVKAAKVKYAKFRR